MCLLAVQPTPILLFPFKRMVFELHTECCCPQEWLHLLSSREEEEEEVNGSRCTSVKDPGGSSCVLWFCSVLLLHSLRYMASMDQYRRMNCVQHSVLNTTRECFVYRSCSLLTVLVFLADLHAKIHCVTGFGRTSLSTPFFPCCFAFCFMRKRKAGLSSGPYLLTGRNSPNGETLAAAWCLSMLAELTGGLSLRSRRN